MKRIVSSVVVVMAIGVGVNELVGHAQQTTVAGDADHQGCG